MANSLMTNTFDCPQHGIVKYKQEFSAANCPLCRSIMTPVFGPLTKVIKADSDANPKHHQGTAKLPLHLWPQTATAMGCIGMLEGAEKYGRNNFRGTDVVASIYVAALFRHVFAWFNGEEYETMKDPETGEEVIVKPHLAGALSCLAIIVDAEANNSLIDDRNYTHDKEVNYHSLVQYLTPFVGRIQELFKDRNPKHWTIQDDKHDL